jgi:hypothetical protein
MPSMRPRQRSRAISRRDEASISFGIAMSVAASLQCHLLVGANYVGLDVSTIRSDCCNRMRNPLMSSIARTGRLTV